MINFRFHLVSLVAVFLALAVGVVMGYGVLGQPTVRGLQSRINSVEANAEARRRENDDLHVLNEQLDTEIAALGPYAVTDRLPGVPVVVVAARGVSGDTLRATVELARQGGAGAPGILWLESKWSLAGDGEPAALAKALGIDSTKRAAIRDAGWQALAARLAAGSGIGTDLLRTLTNAGFVTFESVGETQPLSQFGGADTRLLLAVGTDEQIPAKQLLVPFARAARAAALPLVVVEAYHSIENGADRGALVGLVRADVALDKAVGTVDDLDRRSGPVVAVLALADLGRGLIGHYGIGADVSGLAPAWWQP